MALNHTGTVELRTERLVLRRFTMDDTQAMFDNWMSDPVALEYLYWPAHQSVTDTEKVLHVWVDEYSQPDSYKWCITLNKEPIGYVCVENYSEIQEACEVGYCLSKRFWGQGIMPEALGAVIDHMFGAVGFHRIAATHDANNPKSGRVMEKCGMTKEGVKRQVVRNQHGEWVDDVLYAILRDEWAEKGGK